MWYFTICSPFCQGENVFELLKERHSNPRARSLSCLHLPSVTPERSAANPFLDLVIGAKSKGSRECLSCHADSGNSTTNLGLLIADCWSLKRAPLTCDVGKLNGDRYVYKRSVFFTPPVGSIVASSFFKELTRPTRGSTIFTPPVGSIAACICSFGSVAVLEVSNVGFLGACM